MIIILLIIEIIMIEIITYTDEVPPLRNVPDRRSASVPQDIDKEKTF